LNSIGEPLNLAAAFEAACFAELRALKPGNVHDFAPGHNGMTVADFEVSASAAAPYIAEEGREVGARILKAVRATREKVGQNTNLGIVLLCAPLAAAWENAGDRDLYTALHDVLASLNREDAALAFQAINIANPGGIGREAAHDVRDEPRITLLEAMRLAALRDRIAHQYVTDFHDIFELAHRTMRVGMDDAVIAEQVYWAFLTRFPDTHIARKYGLAKAEEVCEEARVLNKQLADLTARDQTSITHLLLAFDTRLKSQGINPGTSADLTVATLFLQKLCAAKEE
jgi:triphosphoribosyl-dephospho-CoA synthase